MSTGKSACATEVSNEKTSTGRSACATEVPSSGARAPAVHKKFLFGGGESVDLVLIGWPRRSKVAIEARMAAAFPISRRIGCGLDSGPQRAQESFFFRINHNAHMPGPYDQVSRFWMVHAFEAGHALIQDPRRRVVVVESRALKKPLHEVGAIEISGLDLLAHADQGLVGGERGKKSAGLVGFRDEFGEHGSDVLLGAESAGSGY